MARIAGIDLPREKRVEIGLTYIYGIGPAASKRLLTEAGISIDIGPRPMPFCSAFRIGPRRKRCRCGKKSGHVRSARRDSRLAREMTN
jgi:hypothetical protein